MLRAVLMFAGFLPAGFLAAQAPAGFMPAGISYDPSVTTPAEAFGHELGERATRYDQLISYFEEMARVSNRVAMDTLGRSVEGRPVRTFPRQWPLLAQQAAREAGVHVEYLVFEDEGHGFRRRDNRVAAVEAYVDFLDRFLGLGGELPSRP